MRKETATKLIMIRDNKRMMGRKTARHEQEAEEEELRNGFMGTAKK